MLPLRAALDKSGTAPLLAEDVVGTLEAFGPYVVLFGLLVLFN
jgi:di/tricarboxylate transporter